LTGEPEIFTELWKYGT